jgi:tRNA/tmRNA/rRNA uracil-C5-methylase (TrmA/RlmC/RlmD family)
LSVRAKQQKIRTQGAWGRRPAASAAPASTFAGLLKPLIAPPPSQVDAAALSSAPLAHLDYPAELRVKDTGLRLFWKHYRMTGWPESVVASPRPRGYRTTSKRRTIFRGSRLCLLFGDKAGRLQEKQAFSPSPLEPPEHEHIYRFLQQKLSEPPFRLAAAHMNYLIIRGSYTQRAVIFNVDMLNGPLVRKLKMLAVHLQTLPSTVSAAFVYLDPSGSDYYLESRRPADTLHFKKLFGPDRLAVVYEGRQYLFHSTSFSQINESMVPILLNRGRELLAPTGDGHLLDLYCGYGLFSHYLAPLYKQVLAIDAEGPSIRAAKANSRLNKGRGSRPKFLDRRITEGLFARELAAPAAPENILLDPPRQGPLPGVISILSRRCPQKVLHIFCGVDQIPAALKEWQANGLRVRRIVPLDMFPGSANLEVLILLTPGKHIE